MAQRRLHYLKSLLSFLFIIPNLFNVVSNITTLAGLEARIAGKSLVFIITLSFLVTTLIFTSWLCLLALFFIYLVSLQLSYAMALGIILLLNILLLIIFIALICRAKRNLLFLATREQCRSLQRIVRNS